MALTQTLCILSNQGVGSGVRTPRKKPQCQRGEVAGPGTRTQGWVGEGKGLLDGGWPSRLRMPGLRMEQGLRDEIERHVSKKSCQFNVGGGEEGVSDWAK